MAGPTDTAPKAPSIGIQELAHQFWHDIYGKEVQDATTYSYVWLADQMGHLCIGILLTAIIGGLLYLIAGNVYVAGPVAFVLTAGGVAGWEYLAFSTDVKKATGRFPLDQKLLMENAIIATAYMALGAAVGLAIWLGGIGGFAIGFLVALIAFLAAPYWLKQKIVWQKASLPYLARLANAMLTISDADAKTVQAMIDAGAPPQVPPRQTVIAGAIGSGRTSLSIGIGTEHAFKDRSVRFVSFDQLLEFAAGTNKTVTPPKYGDDSGPPNICYWPWVQAQVLIIDDIGPVVENVPGEEGPAALRALLKDGLGKIRDELKLRDTIWILGDPGTDAAMHAYVKAIADFCEGAAAPTVVRLSEANKAIPSTPPTPPPAPPKTAPAPAAPAVPPAAPATPPVASTPPAAATAPAPAEAPAPTAAETPHEPEHPHHHHKS